MGRTHLIIDAADGERNEGEKIVWSLAVHAANRATPEIIGAVKDGTLFFKPGANVLAKCVYTFRHGDHYKVISANMTYKVIGAAILAHRMLTNLSHQANHIIASQESVGVVKSLEVVKIEVDHAPRFHAIQLILDG